MAGIFLPSRPKLIIPPPGTLANLNHPLMRGIQTMFLCNEGGGVSIADCTKKNPAGSLASSTVGPAWFKPNSSGGGQAPLSLGINGGSSIGHWQCGNICDNLATFTVAFWSYHNSGGCVIGKFGSGGFSSGQGWGVVVNGNRYNWICQMAGGSVYQQYYATADGSSLFNQNRHWAFTISNYLLTGLYIDGVSFATSQTGTGSTGTVTTTTNSNQLQFGASTGTTDPTNGMSVNAAGVWNRVLSAGEIQQLATDPFCFIQQPSKTLLSKGRIVKKLTALNLTPLGIASQEALGAPTFGLGIGPGGIKTEEKFGAQLIANTQILTPFGITSQEMLGAPGTALNLLPLGVTSQEIIGAENVAINNASNILPGGVTSQEGVGEPIITGAGINPGGISSAENFGGAGLALNLLPLGVTSQEAIGAIKAALGLKKLITVPQRRYMKRWKPITGTQLNPNSSIIQGLVLASPFLEQGGNTSRDLIGHEQANFVAPFTPISWVRTDNGFAPQCVNSNRVLYPTQPRFTDLPLTGNGSMSVSFRILFNSSICGGFGGTIMGKSDSTDGSAGSTAGWNVNCDNNYSTMTGIDPSYVTSPINYIPNTSSGPHVIKLEFECDQWNKQGGVYVPNTPDNQMHQITICTQGGMVGAAAELDDYTVYLDGQLIVRDPAHRSFIIGAKYFYCASGNQTTSDAAYNLSIGAHPGGSNSIQSPIDNVLVHNRVLTADEAMQLYVDPYCYLQRPKRLFAALASSSLQYVFPGGVSSEQKFGAESFAVQTAQSITPLGIMSAEEAGATIFATAQILFPGGIPSEARVGGPNANTPIVQFINPDGIASAENVGSVEATIANIQNLFPGGIVSLEFVEDSNFSGFVVKSPEGRTFRAPPIRRIIRDDAQF